MARKRKSLSAAVDKELKSKFDLGSFKDKKGLASNVKFKSQDWIPLSPAFQNVTSIPGIPMGHIVLLRGHSDTGKTTALLEAAVSAQKRKILPVFIITEMKWSWEHAQMMGLEVKEIFDEEWVDVHRNPARRRYVELHPMKAARKIYGDDYEGKEDVHWQIYWEYDNGAEWKESAIKYRIHQIETILEKTGRETYRLYAEGNSGRFLEEHRNNLYPVMANGD